MRIHNYTDNNEMVGKAKSIVMEAISHNPGLLLCAATGSSVSPLYKMLGKEAQKNRLLFKNLRIIPLDEWIGLPTAEGSCHSYLSEHLIVPLKISEERYFPFNTTAANLEKECLRIQGLLKIQGPIDLCILGLGKNGHLGFNEPAQILHPHCHIANLSTQSQHHTMVAHSEKKPTHGLTLGMQDVLSSKQILILVSGNGKEKAKQQLLSGKIDPQCPASFLWKHQNVDCLVRL